MMPAREGEQVGAGGIRLCEIHPRHCQLFYIGRFVRTGRIQIIQLNILPAKIINIKDDHIGYR